MPEADFSTTVFGNANESGGTGNAMTAYRTQQQNNSNWLFGNPVAAEFNGFIAVNNSFQQSYLQGAAGAGRTLQAGFQQAGKWAADSQNLVMLGAGIVGLVLVGKLLNGSKTKARR